MRDERIRQTEIHDPAGIEPLLAEVLDDARAVTAGANVVLRSDDNGVAGRERIEQFRVQWLGKSCVDDTDFQSLFLSTMIQSLSAAMSSTLSSLPT